MFIRVHLWVLTGCLLVTSACGPSPSTNKPAPVQAPEVSYDFTTIDNLLQRIAPQHGGAALVLIKDDKVIYRKSFGNHTADKVVPVASASKWLSGALIMTLVDEGKLSLDDPAAKYVPEWTRDPFPRD